MSQTIKTWYDKKLKMNKTKNTIRTNGTIGTNKPNHNIAHP